MSSAFEELGWKVLPNMRQNYLDETG